ncbi:MAG: type II toxin-antitoxin system VapB family antitoxin [Aquabacterium sp.]|nr:type II toxin-antitoxin system VapB family antitoxin [Aquabacterium sp.]
MRTNIDIDDAVLDAAMKAGPFKTKKEAVEAGLRAIARQAHYREVLRWEGKLRWDGDADATPPGTAPLAVHEPPPRR